MIYKLLIYRAIGLNLTIMLIIVSLIYKLFKLTIGLICMPFELTGKPVIEIDPETGKRTIRHKKVKLRLLPCVLGGIFFSVVFYTAVKSTNNDHSFIKITKSIKRDIGVVSNFLTQKKENNHSKIHIEVKDKYKNNSKPYH